MHRKLSQDFLDEKYYDCVRNTPRPFCQWCAEKFRKKIAVPVRKGKITFCRCMLCVLLKNVEFTRLFEVNGHYTTCPSQVK